MHWNASTAGTSERSCRRVYSTRASMSPTPTWPWSWAAPSGCVSMCGEWVDCCVRARVSEPSCTSLSLEIPSKSVRRAGDARVLLSADLLSYSVAGTLVVPHYLGEHDHPWLQVLLEEHERFIGRPQRDLEARLRDPLPCDSPPRKLRLAIKVLGRLRPHNRKSVVPPRQTRAHVFGAAARTSGPPPAVWTAVATSMGGHSESSYPSWRGVHASACKRSASSMVAVSRCSSGPVIRSSPPVRRADTIASLRSASPGSSDGSLPRGM